MLAGLRLGMTRRAAAAYAGYSKTTLYRMLEKDTGTLGTAIEKAEGEAEASHTAKVSADKSWQASAWWLERRHPDDYGRRDRVDVTVNVQKLAEGIAGDLDPAEVMAEAERIMQGAR